MSNSYVNVTPSIEGQIQGTLIGFVYIDGVQIIFEHKVLITIILFTSDNTSYLKSNLDKITTHAAFHIIHVIE